MRAQVTTCCVVSARVAPSRVTNFFGIVKIAELAS